MKKNECPVPPMGWNSFDAFGSSVTEEQFKKNVDYMADNLKDLGWEYAVVDFCWSHPDPGAVSNPDLEYDRNGKGSPALAMDEYGRLLPHPDRFPSAAGGRGFKPLADYVHSKGLKFGIHIMRGIPRNAVYSKLPVKGSDQCAADIANPASTCRWLNHMTGVDMTKPGSQDYYDSLFELYSDWEVDFIKADDLTYLHPHPGLDTEDDQYAQAEIEAISKALHSCGRPMILSLSCGPTPLSRAEHVKRFSHMWRITLDFWDNWDALKELFYYARCWMDIQEEGAWPDADMIPFGRISLCGPKGAPRYSNFSDDEKQTLMTLLVMYRSPLLLGGNLPEIDEASLNLLTNKEALALNQQGTGSRELFNNGKLLIWHSTLNNRDYLAFFHLGEDFEYDITPAEKPELQEIINGCRKGRDVWTAEMIGLDCTVSIRPHSALLLAIEE